MKDIKYGKIVDFIHFLIKGSYEGIEDIVAVDCTCGNGNDTVFLCDLAGDRGKVYAFDIQEIAIKNTKGLLQEKGLNNCTLIKDSHENVLKYADGEIDIAIFNLGYLPKSDKSVKTNTKSTIAAIANILQRLSNRGRVYIATYILQDEGQEAREILDYIKNLSNKEYNSIAINLVNKNNSPPGIYIVEKI